MVFIKLERLDDLEGNPFNPPKHLHLNTDRIESWGAGKTGLTALRMASGERWNVAIEPDDLAAAIDPEGACPDGGPSRCGYHDYLGRGDGSGDLSHTGWHALVKANDQHAGCSASKAWAEGKRKDPCSLCMDFERRLRS